MLDYIELQTTSNFSFLEGASHPEELVRSAAALGYKGLGLCDRQSLAGIVRAHIAAKDTGSRFYAGCRVEVFETENQGHTILAYPTNRGSYASLCRLLSVIKTRPANERLTTGEFLKFHKDLALILVPPFMALNPALCNAQEVSFMEFAIKIKDGVSSKEILSIALTNTYANAGSRRLHATRQAAEHLELPLVVTGDVCYHTPARRALQDVLSCIRHGCTIEKAGYRLSQNAERYMKPVAEIVRLHREFPAALRRCSEVAEMAGGFSLEQLRYEYPSEICPQGHDPFSYLTSLTQEGAARRYPAGVPPKVEKLIAEELALIRELKYEKYFLTCYDIVKFARSRGILCQGRGAAANSAVCFCLGITAVDPQKIDMLFARFVSKEREEPPDIDIDFEHERREEVIQYIYEKYGRERAGLTCEVVTYRQRSAVREVGKALGLSLALVDKLAKSIHRWTECKILPGDMCEMGINPADITISNVIAFSNELLGFPRHLSQHVGGFIICEHALCETVPILNAATEGRTIIEWNKDDIEALGMLKIDVLGLGMLTCIRKALQLINKRRIAERKAHLELHIIAPDDATTYEMICAADTIGVFQIESRAQMSMLPRLKPRCFYDLVIEVAIVRPGPIQGNMVHPYLKRRNGLEQPWYPDKRVEEILGKTLGVPIFQEQAMRLVITLANFSPGEAERLRRAMVAWRRNKELIEQFKERIVKGMLANGYTLQFAEICVNQIRGFSEYGFPESHAASFALLVYASAWIKKHYPAEFAAALLNSQPMGFYSPSQIVTDAKKHGVPVLPVDSNYSAWDCTLSQLDDCAEGQSRYALRLGLRLVRGLGKEQADVVSGAVASYGKFNDVYSLWSKTRGKTLRLRKISLFSLARADAFASMGLNRREALWEVLALPEDALPLDNLTPLLPCEKAELPSLSAQQSMFHDYAATGLSLKAHPLQFVRDYLTQREVSTAQSLAKRPTGAGGSVSVAGLAICRQRPSTAKGVVFITLEDETGIANLIVPAQIFEKYRQIIINSSGILASGRLERVGEVVYISVQELSSLDALVISTAQGNLPGKSYSY